MITVTDVDHGCVVGDFVTFDAAVSLGGNITAAVLNQEYQVVSVVDGDQYKFLPRTVSTIESITVDGALNETPVRPNSSDTGNGGSNTTAAYQIGAGLDIAVRAQVGALDCGAALIMLRPKQH